MSRSGRQPPGSMKVATALEQGECAEVAATGAIPLALGRSAAANTDEVHFWVRYSLREYVGFMWQHTGFLIRRRRIRWPASIAMRLRSTAQAAFHFILLRRGTRTYEMTIDQHGIVRTSDSGVTLIGWADVKAMRTYSHGLMIMLKRGTLPIPFRCLKEREVDALRALVSSRRRAAETL